jgi:hypothetical protein
MHLNIVTSLTLTASLAGHVLAMPASNQFPNIQKRAERPNWAVRVYPDDTCYEYTGIYRHNAEKCENLDNFSVDILSINGEVEGAVLNDNNCGWALYAYPELNCKGGGEMWNHLSEGECGKGGIAQVPIKSFGIYHFGPCN